MAVTLKSVDPLVLTIGNGATECYLIGEELNTKGLEVGIMDAAGVDIDTKTIVVEQPQKNDVTASRFPFTATALAKAKATSRKIVIKHKDEELDKGACPKGSATCDILDPGIEIEY